MRNKMELIPRVLAQHGVLDGKFCFVINWEDVIHQRDTENVETRLPVVAVCSMVYPWL